ncbi:hypothetical protein AWZ03_004734 [Drosophila navojoa]|uniref:CHK kinase-like domain-containing protein n=1 Tax=Drosophila navojoa TaxID=7232 RepID=A0A484BM65_DRONA|nr:hypothetical protein AWZ03_004734 [Drosophila navojoa]
MSTAPKPEPTANNVPDWVQAELFEDVLKETVQGFSKIKSFKAISGSAAGENYTTIMFRLHITVELEDGKEKLASYMLKVPHQMEIFQKFMEINNIFINELDMYKTIVPELEQIYRDAGIEVKFGAKAYELKGVKSDYVLLEDLAPKGFRNTNRIEGLDQVHVKCALRRLAMWHAASMVRVATKGDYPDYIVRSYYKKELLPILTDVNTNLAQNFLKAMAEVDPNFLNVLNHGDFWSNNMMFSYDSLGKIKDLMLVDFQVPKWGSVAQDLVYFLISSAKFEDKLTKFDSNIKFYYDNLLENLSILKYPKSMPLLRELHITIYKYGFWGYLTATGAMSTVLVDSTDTASFENFLSDSTEGADFKNLLYTNPRYLKHIQAVLPWLLNRGALQGF